MVRRLMGAAMLGMLAWAVPAIAEPPANDPLYAQQWSHETGRVAEAWRMTRGAGVVVAVVDSGVDPTHPDLQGRLVPGRSFLGCPAGSTDGCGDGSMDPKAPASHATQVAGVIAANAGNGIGVAGVAPEAKIMSVRVEAPDITGGDGGYPEGIRWAVEHGADIINVSASHPPLDHSAEESSPSRWTQAVLDARRRGVIVVMSAGNESDPMCDTPGYFADICAIAVDRRGLKSYYSSSAGAGPDASTNAVGAPSSPGPPFEANVPVIGGPTALTCGEGVVSTYPVSMPTSCVGAGYHEFGGTSAAAPFVSGVAALLLAQGRSRANVVEAILKTARHPLTEERGGQDPVYGRGVVDAAAAVAYPGAAPPAPGSGSSDAASGEPPPGSEPSRPPCPPTLPAQPSPSAPSRPATAGGRVRRLSLRAMGGRTVVVRLRCSGGACAGTLVVTVGPTIVGRVRYRLATRVARTFTIRLRRTLAGSARLVVTARTPRGSIRLGSVRVALRH